MKIGTLVPQRDTGRMDIRFSPNNYYGGLQCGEPLEMKINGDGFPPVLKWETIGISSASIRMISLV